ncbi:MAG: hypothetical protein CMH57_08885 [Myxococcales bacterium]|nr:hypothetical protein [Myxococcales bacterium]
MRHEPQHTRWLSALLLALALVAATALTACPSDDGGGDDGAATSGSVTGGGLPEGCDAAALAAQCPPGSDPLTGPEAFDACQGESGAQLTDSSGAIGAICEGTGACLVVCNLQDPCTCGVDRITTEGIFCVECNLAPACGNAICEGGEDPQSCPVDCAAQCMPDQGRCSGEQLQICQGNGSWDDVACRSDQACTVSGRVTNAAFCQTRISPSGGSRPPIASPPRLEHDPAEIAFLDANLCEGANQPGCFGVDVMRGGEQGLVISGGLKLVDVDTQESASLDDVALPYNGTGATHTFDVQGERLAWCDGRNVRVHDLGRAATQNMAEFVDDTIPLECSSVALADGGRLVAASMSLEGDAMVAVWDAASGAPEKLLRFVDPELGVGSAARQLAVDPEGRWLVECRDPDDSFQGLPLLIVWNLAEGRYFKLIQFEGGCTGEMLIRPGHLQLFHGGRLWDLDSGEAIWSLGEESADAAAVSSDGSVFALTWARGGSYCGTANGCSVLVNGDSGRILRSFGSSGRRAFSDDGRFLMIDSYIYDGSF